MTTARKERASIVAAGRSALRNATRRADGSTTVYFGAGVFTAEADGGFTAECHECGEDVSYGSLYGDDGMAYQCGRFVRHLRRHEGGGR